MHRKTFLTGLMGAIALSGIALTAQAEDPI